MTIEMMPRNRTRRPRLRLRLRGVAVLALAAAAVGGVRPATAQDSPRAPGAAEDEVRVRAAPGAGYFFETTPRPRLGVFLRPGCEIGPDVTEPCVAPPVVASVVQGAPAARAGVLPGDTLLALDGSSLRQPEGRRSMARLRAGEPVVLELSRQGQRRSVRVTPVVEPASGVFRMNGTAWRTAPSGGEEIAVVRFRDDEGRVAQYQAVPRPDSGARARGFVMFHTDESGTLSLEFGSPELDVRAPDGRPVRLNEIEARLRLLESELVSDSTRPVVVEDVEIELATQGHRLILENEELARRLEAVRAAALSDARVRLDSVVRVRAALVERGELSPEAGYRVRTGAAPAPPVWVPGPDESDDRLAGAEFRSLTPDLAEYFSVDRGLLVLRVIPETPAHRIGLRGGDVVVEVGAHKMPDIKTFRRLVVESERAQRPLVVKWYRKGTLQEGRLNSP